MSPYLGSRTSDPGGLPASSLGEAGCAPNMRAPAVATSAMAPGVPAKVIAPSTAPVGSDRAMSLAALGVLTTPYCVQSSGPLRVPNCVQSCGVVAGSGAGAAPLAMLLLPERED